MFNGVYAAPDKETISQKIATLTQACDACVKIVPGGEVRYSYEMLEEVGDPGARIRLNGGAYMLLGIPFPFNAAERRGDDIPDFERGRHTGHCASGTQQEASGEA